jgi:putative transposase
LSGHFYDFLLQNFFERPLNGLSSKLLNKNKLLVSSLRQEECRMPKKKRAVALTPDEQHELETFVAHGKKSAREITRARVLLLAQDGRRATDIAQTLGVARGTIYNVCKKYKKKARTSLVAMLQDAPRSGRPLKFDGRVEAKVTMIACSDPPEGRGRWTLHLIADKLVKLDVIDAISHESVRQMLKKTNLSRG